MNIFVLDECPIQAAQMQHDWHVNKQALEVAQMGCTVLHAQGIDPARIPYKTAHPNHPVTLWMGESRGNFAWAVQYGLACIDEHYYRHSDGERVCKTTHRPHRAEGVLQWLWGMLDSTLQLTTNLARTPFAQAMPEQYQNPDDPVVAYWDYYLHEKSRSESGKCAPWTRREPPEFWQKYIHMFDPDWRNPK